MCDRLVRAVVKALCIGASFVTWSLGIQVMRNAVAGGPLRDEKCIMRRCIFLYEGDKENDATFACANLTLFFCVCAGGSSFAFAMQIKLCFLRICFFTVLFPVGGFASLPGSRYFGGRFNFLTSVAQQLFERGGIGGGEQESEARRVVLPSESFVAPATQKCCLPAAYRFLAARARANYEQQVKLRR